MHRSYVSNNGLNHNLLKKAGFNEIPHFLLLAIKETGSARDIYW